MRGERPDLATNAWSPHLEQPSRMRSFLLDLSSLTVFLYSFGGSTSASTSAPRGVSALAAFPLGAFLPMLVTAPG